MVQSRLLCLDSLRGIAAFAVVIYHYFFRYNEIYSHKEIQVGWAVFGQYGVNLFFIISGFVIILTISKIKRPLDFIYFRFSRLYPVYWVALSITFIVVAIFGLPGRAVNFENFVLNFLMFHQFFNIPNVDGVYWTLAVELVFYFWVFLIIFFFKIDRIEFVFIFFMIISAVIDFFEFKIGLISTMLMSKYISFFCLGILLYRVFLRREIDSCLVVCFIACFSYEFFINGLLGLFIAVSLAAFFFLAVFGYISSLNNPVTVFLGAISYSLYLVHQNIGYVVISQMYSHGFAALAAVSTAVFVSLILASLLYFFVEKPCLSYLKINYDRFRNR